MCTSVALRRESLFFGRNMDIDYNFGEEAVVSPMNFPLTFKKIPPCDKHYPFIGMAAVYENYPLYAEGMNDSGLCIAALKFDGNAHYCDSVSSGKTMVAPYELIPYVLGKCRNLNEVKALLSGIDISNIPFNEQLPLSPLHWHIADNSGSITVERTKEGMNILDNPADVLTNNPPLPFHLNNLSLYSHLSADCHCSDEKFRPFGSGFGGIGLPGDFSSPSRFVRAYFLLKNSSTDFDGTSQLFHILENASIPCGAVLNSEGKNHYTTYTCCMDTKNKRYLYKTYSGYLHEIKLDDDIIKEDRLIRYAV